MSQYPTPTDSHHQPSVSPEYQKLPANAGFTSRSARSKTPESHFLPASPPFSCAASQIEASAFPSPQFSCFTPPSSVSMSAEQSSNSLPPTFAATIDTDHVMLDSGEADAPAAGSNKRKIEDVDVDMDAEQDDHKRRRTDHDRQEQITNKPSEPATKSTLSSVYKLCQTPYPISRPHPSQDLLALYGLNDIAASVARTDPKTGEKINKLRKSYEGKIKELGLSGKNKAVSIPNEFTGLIAFPDEEWHVQKLMGKELGRGLSEDILSKLAAATTLAPGKLPADEHDRWRNILAIEETPRNPVQPANKAAPNTAPLANLASISRPEIPRPKRKGTERRYDDKSYEGYGDAFADDAGTGASDDGDDGTSVARKKRRKVKSPAAEWAQQPKRRQPKRQSRRK